MNNIRIQNKIAIVTATTNYHPLYELSKIKEYLISKNFRGSILFDMFAINGRASNRFATSMINRKNEISKPKVIKNTSFQKVRKEQNKEIALHGKELGIDLSEEDIRKLKIAS